MYFMVPLGSVLIVLVTSWPFPVAKHRVTISPWPTLVRQSSKWTFLVPRGGFLISLMTSWPLSSASPKPNTCWSASVLILHLFVWITLEPFLLSISLSSQQMELLILNKLKWDLASVTPLDFIDHFLSQLAVRRESRPVLRKHAHTFVALCATGKLRVFVPPSTWLSLSASVFSCWVSLSSSVRFRPALHVRCHEVTFIINLDYINKINFI